MKKIAHQHVNFIAKHSVKMDNVRHPVEEHKNTKYLKDLALYNNIVVQTANFQLYKFFLNNIAYANFFKYTNNYALILNNKASYLKITWYNKVHNSVVKPIKQNLILYLRAARHFNKGRYSRNRQLYRTGVY